ncbi:MAG TPA: hypothetical protein DE036_09210, partial [Actinobacteria bacterium]|nr:hypothetical protein [Actinomycetota bacterium]
MFGLFQKSDGKRSDKSHRQRAKSNSLIELEQVVKIYENEAGSFPALKDIDLRVSTHEFVAIIGKSGSGKSTLINMIAGIDRPTSGRIIVDGQVINALNEGQVAQWRG